MLKTIDIIDFEPDAYQKRNKIVFDGIWPSREEFDHTLVKITQSHALWSDYKAWAEARDLNPVLGSLLVPLENSWWLKRGQANLEQQTKHYKNGGTALTVPGLPFEIPTDLKLAFEKAAQNKKSGDPISVISFAGTRETLFFALDEMAKNHGLVLNYFSFGNRADDRQTRQDTIEVTVPDIAGRFKNITNTNGIKADIIHFTSWLHYCPDEESVANYIDQASASKPSYIVMSNTVVSGTNGNHNAEEYWLQRQFGGGMLVRAAPEKELADMLTSKNYAEMHGAFNKIGKPTYNKSTEIPANNPWPTEKHYIFELK